MSPVRSQVRKPNALQLGSQVRIVTPASPLTLEKIQTGIDALEEWGYRVTLGQSVFMADGYLAGNDRERAVTTEALLANQ